MDEAAAKEAVQRLKEAIYDVQIGEAEITPSHKHPAAYVVKFDTRAGEAGAVLVPASLSYQEMVALLRGAHDGKRPG